MANLLARRELSYIQEWSDRTNRKPLVIRGARQVGKSTLVRQFARESGLHLFEINFERNPEYREAFSVKDPDQVISTLQLLADDNIVAGKTLLFLDEIQAAPEALAVLRYFYEEQPALHIIAAGSLLEFTLADAQFSMPVGRIEYLHLGAMQFEDFLIAVGQSRIVAYLQNLSLEDIRNNALPSVIHKKCMTYLKQFWITGGLPEVIAEYAERDDFAQVARIQQNIVATYRDDFNKYSHGTLKQLVQLVFDQLPAMVGRKFKYAHVSRDYRAAELEKALQHLCHARIATKVFHTSANGVPLAAEVNPRFFKALYLDIGLLCAALNLNVLDLGKEDLSLINKGALAEQFIGQHLLYSELYYQKPELYYWVRETKSAAAEIDYLISSGQHIVPVEIKAGTTGTLKSVHQFLKEKKQHFALRFNADVPSLLNDTKKLTDGSTLNYELLSLPLYLIGQTSRLTSACLSSA
ncbi:Predicted ATPase (AAA+ superfamily) [hydrothermal vent metagenome]|uniref:Predicted ATPase (AAA+ superfamily) n=1 Tax=hydrothermal vent metagenome TaxID=652676 RepID=A0A3B1B1Y9_9ZZZZ